MEEAASLLEREHVHSVYERIAPYFNDSRYKAWPKVRQFLLEQEPGSIVADVGCGNGKYLNINDDVFKLGCDVCRPLVDAARSQGYEVQVCDGLRLPYRDGCFDAVLSIAVIHHLSTKERRIRAIREMARTLRVGGRLMIYVWAMEQKRRKFEKQDVFIPWNPNPPSSPAKSRRQAAKAPSGGGHGDAGSDGDKHRKVKSTSSMAEEEDEDAAGARHQRSQRLWFFSRSLDSVLDFGSLATPRPPTRELNGSCAQVGDGDGMRACRRGRGAGLIKQVSSLFSSSANSSEEDVFGSVTDQRGGGKGRSEGKQAVYGTIVHGCGSVPLPDLVMHQREKPEETGRGDGDAELRGTPPRRQASSECLGEDEEVNGWNRAKPTDSCLRYYHVFREGELQELIETHVEELHVLQSCLDHANWCVVAEKVQVWKI
ncbi:probable tRNA methyltransferase 9B [Megalops cyprinoides]|uniref:probable tRNA methyltransferase 9B n=1 Tax=Megalops cyprinoides TaxID=118141 RepID=UPI0018643EF5|nr:probable tRNA methyltransferase 9B [Megalops cyprinoides]XP_036393128.1 probable tRNA methyltransferase 9B [Megalops cyprinoides]XP_036393129.1 probable tRNA methyltransferase 9B [Megalops cyprinoides]XP_036393130.1 probable tRNA methyltransferase 9B [Megalops cyprinoides]